MYKDHLIPAHLQACHDVHRETFAALMDLYENNYLRLRKLIPEIIKLKGQSISHVAGCLDLHLTIIEQSKYTTLLSLSYQFDREVGQAREPDLQIRVYHDVGMAEVLSGCLHHGALNLKNLPETAIQERWHLNRFLYKWLGFCLRIGHRLDCLDDSKNLNRRINQILSAKISS